jgi:hypothetical protein
MREVGKLSYHRPIFIHNMLMIWMKTHQAEIDGGHHEVENLLQQMQRMV